MSNIAGMSHEGTARGWKINLGIVFALSLLTFAVFAQTTRFAFLNYDDDLFISQNPRLAAGLSGKGIAWAFTANLTHPDRAAEYWEPLTLLTRLADVQLHGLDAGWHHLTNVVIHLAAGLVLFGALQRLLRSFAQSAVVAGLFLIHPLHVEAVAWLSARKDLLNGLFYFATIWAYAWYAAPPRAARYLLVCLSFLCANMAKPMAVSLPLVLLALDFWPLRRFGESLRTRRALLLCAEKLPLFAIAAGVSWLAFRDQQAHGAMGDDLLYPLNVRIANVGLSFCNYLLQIFWPTGLAAFYPHTRDSLGSPVALAAAAVCLLITLVFFLQRDRRPWLIVGWVWFLVVLLPVSGLVQIGELARADRYTYVALVGIFIFCVRQIAEWTNNWRVLRPQLTLGVLASVTLLLLGGLAVAAIKQTSTWRDSVSVFTHAIAVTDNNYIAEANLGSALFAVGRKEEGLQHYREAIRLNAPVIEYHRRAAIAADDRGDLPTAIHHYSKVLTYIPWDEAAHQRLGGVLLRAGDAAKALVQFNEALRYDRAAIPPRLGVARALILQGRTGEALALLQRVLEADPSNEDALRLLQTLNTREAK